MFPQEQEVIYLNEEQWIAFNEALNAPPRELPRLKRLLTEPGFFDTIESKQYGGE